MSAPASERSCQVSLSEAPASLPQGKANASTALFLQRFSLHPFKQTVSIIAGDQTEPLAHSDTPTAHAPRPVCDQHQQISQRMF